MWSTSHSVVHKKMWVDSFKALADWLHILCFSGNISVAYFFSVISNKWKAWVGTKGDRPRSRKTCQGWFTNFFYYSQGCMDVSLAFNRSALYTPGSCLRACGTVTRSIIVNKLHCKKVVGRWSANHLPTTKDPFMPWWISCKTVGFTVKWTTYGKNDRADSLEHKLLLHSVNIYICTHPITYKKNNNSKLNSANLLTLQCVQICLQLLYTGVTWRRIKFRWGGTIDRSWTVILRAFTCASVEQMIRCFFLELTVKVKATFVHWEVCHVRV